VPDGPRLVPAPLVLRGLPVSLVPAPEGGLPLTDLSARLSPLAPPSGLAFPADRLSPWAVAAAWGVG